MTPTEIDHWLATEVMGWHVSPGRPKWCRHWQAEGSDFVTYVEDQNDGDCCSLCDWWHPSENVAQAIQCAEVARNRYDAEGVLHWLIGSDILARVDRARRPRESGILLLTRSFYAPTLAQALYDALKP